MRTMPESYGLTDIGLVRQNNEDVFASLPEHNFFILADGMGGHNAGEVASSESVKYVCESIKKLPPALSPSQVTQYLREAIEKANRHIWKMGQNDPSLSGMGTTLTCFLIQDQTLIYGHVGDSRLYRLRNEIQQLTRDHSLRSALIEKGELSEAMRENFPFKNVITRALGTTSHILPDTGILSLAPNDLYLLCSDGLTDLLPDQKIKEILEEDPSPRQAAKNLIAAALKKGGNDNITVLIVKT